MIYYKATHNLKCENVTYEVGKTYLYEGNIAICKKGFHFSNTPNNTLEYYTYNKDFILLEVNPVGIELEWPPKKITYQIVLAGISK